MFNNKKKKNPEAENPNKPAPQEQIYNEKVETSKEETLSSTEAVKTDTALPFTVELWDVWGSTSKKSLRFGARRWIDKGNVFLVNEKRGFKEPFPEDTEEWKKWRIEEVNSELEIKEKNLTKARTGKSMEYSERDLIEDIKVLKSFKRSLELQGKGSYMLIDSDSSGSRPLFMFDRKGNYKLPVFKNIDYSLMYIPTEAKITEASDLIRENDQKNGIPMMNLAAGAFLVLIVIVLCAGLWFAYKTATIDDSLIEVLTNIAQNQATLTEELSKYLEPALNQTINESVTPNLNVVND